ncbi:MAG: hypothetical protein HQ559_15500, partial [Lentisphaerae bacterium]|nr:hypothetical protein [Lentisphaerota bacterium]
LSGDAALKQLCLEGDLYSELARRLWGTPERRADAKTLFLAYSYGMSEEGLLRMIGSKTSLDPANASDLQAKFLDQLQGVDRWKENIREQLATTGYMGTSLGNKRYRHHDGDLDEREKRWCISQIVQGTGSLILKQVIKRVVEDLPDVQILLPMHDALLVEIPEALAEEQTKLLVETLLSCFVSTCPEIEARVSLEPFVPANAEANS